MGHKAIPTEYKGFRFRSRTEARWAVYLDALNLDWLYEKEGYILPSGQYLPDFWIPCPEYCDNNSGYWLEIKGGHPSDIERQKCKELAMETGHTTLLIYGSPTLEIFNTYSFSPIRNGNFVESVRETHSKNTDPEVQNLLDVVGHDPKSEPFWEHFVLITRFLSGQGKEYSEECLIKAITHARGARFEFGESGYPA